MKNILSKSKQAIALALAALLALTSLPNTTIVALAEEDQESLITAEDSQTTNEQWYEEQNEVDQIDPDASTDDVEYAILAATNNNFGAYTVKGDAASTELDYVTAISDPDNVTGSTLKLDSVNGVEIYVIPNEGFEITEANLADAITVKGSYAANDTDATDATKKIAIPDSAYTIAKSTKTEIDNASGKDIKEAYVVTILGGTEWLKAYQQAEYNDGLAVGTSVATDSTRVELLQVKVDDTKVTAKKIDITIAGGNQEIATPRFTYPSSLTATSEINVQGAVNPTSDWAKKNVTLALIKSESEKVVYDKALSATDDGNGSTGSVDIDDGTVKAYFFDSTAGVLTVSNTIIKEAYEKKSTHALTLTISDADDTNTYVIAEKDSLATFKTITYDTADASKEKEKANYTVNVPEKADTTSRLATDKIFPISAIADKTKTGRTVSNVYYSIDGATPVNANKNSGTGSELDAADADGSKDWYNIPATVAVAANAGKTITLSAETQEGVEITLPANTSGKSLVTYKDGEALDTTIATATVSGSDGTAISGALSSKVDTGDYYTFSLQTTKGYKIKNVNVKMYNVDGSGGKNIETETDNLGKYTTKVKVTGKLEVTVTTEATAAANSRVKLTGTSASSTVVDLASGATIDTAGDLLAIDGEPFEFVVNPSADKIITKVEYQMGDMTEKETLTPSTETGKTATIDGKSYYKIPSVDGNIEITTTEVDAVRITKVANEDVKIEYSNQELKDGKTTIHDRAKDLTLTITALNGATIEKVYTTSIATATTITGSNVGTNEITGTSGVYTISKGALTTTAVPTTNDLKVTVVTSRADENYSVSFDTNRDNTENTSGHDEKVTSLTMKAGYVSTLVASGADDDMSGTNGTALTKITISPTITLSDKTTISTLGSGTAKWSWATDTDATKIATFDTGADATFPTTILTSKVAGENTLKFEYVAGFPNALKYEATLPVKTEAMKTVYSKITLFNKWAADGSDAAGLTLTDAQKTVRLDSTTPVIADSMTYAVQTYKKNDDGEDVIVGGTTDAYVAGATSGSKVGTNGFIKKIEYTISPEAGTKLPKPYVEAAANVGSGGSSNGYKLSTFKVAEDLTVKATITFQDDSTTEVTDTLKVLDQTFGYVAIPVVTINGVETPNQSAINLETKTNGVKEASIKWNVYEKKQASVTLTTADDVKTAIESSEIVPVAVSDAVYAAPAIANNADSTYATITGTDSVSVRAEKKTPAGITVTPVITVDGMPVSASAVTVNVYNELTQYTARVVINDNSGEAIADYKYPQLASGELSTITPVTKKATAATAGTANEVYEEFTLTNVTENTVITLPAQSDFTTSTINPKKALYGWSVVQSGVTKYYKADGTEKVAITGNATITALWAYKYKEASLGSGDTDNDAIKAGFVNLYSELGETYTALHSVNESNKLNGTGALTVAAGKEVQLVVGYAPLDLENGPKSTDGSAQYGDMQYTSEGLVVKAADYNNVIVGADGTPITTGKITGKGIGTVALTVEWTDPADSAAKFTTFGTKTAKTDGLKVATLNVTTAAAKSYGVDAEDVTDLEVGMTKTVEIDVDLLNADGTKASDVTTRDTFTDIDFTTSNEKVATVKWHIAGDSSANSLVYYEITGVAPGTATLVFKATDAQGNIAELTKTVNIKVEPSTTVIGAKIVNPITGTDGEEVAVGEEAQLLAIVGNSLILSVTENGNIKNTVDGDWAVAASASDTIGTASGDDIDNGISSGAVTYTGGKATLTPTGLGIKDITVTYKADATTNKEISYTRVIPTRSYVAVAFHGPAAGAETTNYEIYNGTTKIESTKAAYVRVPYVSGKADQVTSGTVGDLKYSASSEGFSAKLAEAYTPTNALEFKGWTASGSSILETGVTAVKADADIEDTLSNWIGTKAASDGIYDLYAVFGAESIKLSNLPDEIVLDEATLSTNPASGTPVKGSDRKYVEIGVMPYTSNEQITIKFSDANKFVYQKDADTLPTSTETGYGTSHAQKYAGTDSTLTKGSTAGGSRTDVFTIAKIYDGTNHSKDYVGTSTLTIVANGETVKEIPVYLNGEFKDGTDAAGADIIRYMERGKVFESGTQTVNGKTHYYKDSRLVIKGVTDITVDGIAKKILVIDSAWFKTEGRKEFEDAAYHIDKDGYLITAQSVTVGSATRYVNSDGIEVTYAMATDDRGEDTIGKYGKYTDPATGVTYKVYEDGSAAEDDKKIVTKVGEFVWTPANNKDYTISSVVTAKVEISYELVNAKTAASDIVDAVVTLNAEKSTDKKKVYDASIATLTGYYKDADTVYDFSKLSGTKIYNVDPATGIGKAGGIEIVGLDTSDEGYDYTGVAVKPTFVVIDNDRDVVLSLGTDYTVKWTGNKGVKGGTAVASVTINGKGNYEGKTVTETFKIVDRFAALTDKSGMAASVKKIEKISNSFVYDGDAFYPSAITVTTTTGSVTFEGSADGKTYPVQTSDGDWVVLSFANNVNKGTATVTATGADGKAKKATYKITAAPFDTAGDKLVINVNKAAWAVKGAVPEIEVLYDGEPLIAGQDYTAKVNYLNKKNVAEQGGTVTITGKGNFAKKATSEAFEIEKLVLSDDSIAAVAAFDGSKSNNVKVTVLDQVGNVVPAKMYTVTVEKDGDDITASKVKLAAGETYTVKVTAKDTVNLDGDGDLDVTIRTNLNKAKVTIQKGYAVEYTGEEIRLDELETDPFDAGLISLALNKAPLEYGTDYVISGYTNNVKKGTMTVYLQGNSDKCSGTKAVKVKIKAKTMKQEK